MFAMNLDFGYTVGMALKIYSPLRLYALYLEILYVSRATRFNFLKYTHII